MDHSKLYEEIYNINIKEHKKNINTERARLKRDSNLFNGITVLITMFGIFASLVISLAIEDNKFALYVVLLIGTALITIVGLFASFRTAKNEFCLSVLDDVLENKVDAK